MGMSVSLVGAASDGYHMETALGLLDKDSAMPSLEFMSAFREPESDNRYDRQSGLEVTVGSSSVEVTN